MLNTNVIALLTDFGMKDPYVGVMKGVIMGINPEARIIDVTHQVEPQNVRQAAFILSKIYTYFPPGTIFNVVVDPGVGGDRKPIAVETGEYTFIAPDNGVLSTVLESSPPRSIVEINNPDYVLHPVSNTFHGRDIFSPAAAYLSRPVRISDLGPALTEYEKLDAPTIRKGDDFIRGRVVFADHFGNLVTDINEQYLAGKEIRYIKAGPFTLDRVNTSYNQSKKGEMLCIVGSYGTLEVSVNQGAAAAKIRDYKDLPVKVKFAS